MPVNLGSMGWNAAAPVANSLRAIARVRRQRHDGAHRRDRSAPPPTRATPSRASTARCCSPRSRVVIVLLLLTYRSPIAWLLPVISAGVALTTAQAVIYLLAAHAGLTVNAQSAGILDVLVFGAGTDYALLLTAGTGRNCAGTRTGTRRWRSRYAGPGPAIVASAGTVIAQPAHPVPRRRSTPPSRMGPVLAIGVAVALAVDDDPAARAARDHRALGVLAGQAGVRLGRADHDRGFWARRRAPHRRAAAGVWIGTVDRARRDGGRAGRAARQRADQRTVVPRHTRTR